MQLDSECMNWTAEHRIVPLKLERVVQADINKCALFYQPIATSLATSTSPHLNSFMAVDIFPIS